MVVRIDGYLVQEKLEAALREIVSDGWKVRELIVPGTRRSWDMGFTRGSTVFVVEFDGDEHYRNTLKIKADREKDAIAARAAMQVVRIPYWVQLDSAIFHHFFGFDAQIEQEFPQGFITTKIFPASFCEMGTARFEREFGALPQSIRDGCEVVARTRCRTRLGLRAPVQTARPPGVIEPRRIAGALARNPRTRAVRASGCGVIITCVTMFIRRNVRTGRADAGSRG